MLRDPSMRRFDLHMHSLRSDGKYPPEEVLERCSRAGLDAISLTDHDLLAPFSPGQHEVLGRPLWLIAGAEVSATHEGQEWHLLVYFPGEVPAAFAAFCASQVAERAERYEEAVGRMGFELPTADEQHDRGALSLTRHHLARALVEAGHAKDLRDAFARYAGGRHVVPEMRVQFCDAIRFAREVGGITSWAHPPVAEVDRLLPVFAAAGLHAIEGLRPTLSPKEKRLMRRAAEKRGLFLTAGSDWHGWCGQEPGWFSADQADLKGFLDAMAA